VKPCPPRWRAAIEKAMRHYGLLTAGKLLVPKSRHSPPYVGQREKRA
jgi:hypothetical protein